MHIILPPLTDSVGGSVKIMEISKADNALRLFNLDPMTFATSRARNDYIDTFMFVFIQENEHHCINLDSFG